MSHVDTGLLDIFSLQLCMQQMFVYIIPHIFIVLPERRRGIHTFSYVSVSFSKIQYEVHVRKYVEMFCRNPTSEKYVEIFCRDPLQDILTPVANYQ